MPRCTEFVRIPSGENAELRAGIANCHLAWHICAAAIRSSHTRLRKATHPGLDSPTDITNMCAVIDHPPDNRQCTANKAWLSIICKELRPLQTHTAGGPVRIARSMDFSIPFNIGAAHPWWSLSKILSSTLVLLSSLCVSLGKNPFSPSIRSWSRSIKAGKERVSSSSKDLLLFFLCQTTTTTTTRS